MFGYGNPIDWRAWFKWPGLSDICNPFGESAPSKPGQLVEAGVFDLLRQAVGQLAPFAERVIPVIAPLMRPEGRLDSGIQDHRQLGE